MRDQRLARRSSGIGQLSDFSHFQGSARSWHEACEGFSGTRRNGPTESAMKAYLKVDHVDKSFARGTSTTEVLKDVSLAVDTGEFVSIIGHSGCGKSTLLNIVAGLTGVTTGAVLLEDR